MPELQRMRADHAPAVLAFELANRAYFASFVSDRGDEFFDRFTEGYDALLAEQEAGTCAFYVLVAEDGSVLGRFNLYDVEDGTAVLGYRVAQQVAGRGVATATVQELCRLVAAQHGLRTLKAAVTHDNVASQKVLTKAGFVPVGPAEPGGKPGTWYQRELAAPPPLTVLELFARIKARSLARANSDLVYAVAPQELQRRRRQRQQPQPFAPTEHANAQEEVPGANEKTQAHQDTGVTVAVHPLVPEEQQPVEDGPRRVGAIALCLHRDASGDLRTRVAIYQQYFLMLQDQLLK